MRTLHLSSCAFLMAPGPLKSPIKRGQRRWKQQLGLERFKSRNVADHFPFSSSSIGKRPLMSTYASIPSAGQKHGSVRLQSSASPDLHFGHAPSALCDGPLSHQLRKPAFHSSPLHSSDWAVFTRPYLVKATCATISPGKKLFVLNLSQFPSPR